MDGSNEETFDNLIVEGIVNIAIDYTTDRLYFCSNLMNITQSSDLDGTNVKIVSEFSVEIPEAITVSKGKS